MNEVGDESRMTKEGGEQKTRDKRERNENESDSRRETRGFQ